MTYNTYVNAIQPVSTGDLAAGPCDGLHAESGAQLGTARIQPLSDARVHARRRQIAAAELVIPVGPLRGGLRLSLNHVATTHRRQRPRLSRCARKARFLRARRHGGETQRRTTVAALSGAGVSSRRRPPTQRARCTSTSRPGRMMLVSRPPKERASSGWWNRSRDATRPTCSGSIRAPCSTRQRSRRGGGGTHRIPSSL